MYIPSYNVVGVGDEDYGNCCCSLLLSFPDAVMCLSADFVFLHVENPRPELEGRARDTTPRYDKPVGYQSPVLSLLSNSPVFVQRCGEREDPHGPDRA